MNFRSKMHWLYFFKGCLICQNTFEYSRTVMGCQLSPNLSFLPSPPWQKVNIRPEMKSNTFPFINLLNSPRWHMNACSINWNLSLAPKTLQNHTCTAQGYLYAKGNTKMEINEPWLTATVSQSKYTAQSANTVLSFLTISTVMRWLDSITGLKDMNLSKLQRG